jgi:pSer/pThr/pTyr-binding forkhead associated (FHA) protein
MGFFRVAAMNLPQLTKFCQACGAVTPIELEVADPDDHVPHLYTFQKPYVLIGSGSINDIVLPHPLVDYRHVYLQQIDGRVFLVDLGSETGVRVRGKQVSLCWLEPSSELLIGPWTIRVRGGSHTHPTSSRGLESRLATRTMHHRPSSWPTIKLEISDSDHSATWRVNRLLALTGSAPRCKLRLQAEDVSTFHCSFVQTESGLWVIDLLSRTGTIVNGKRIRWSWLADGDEVQIGPYLLRPLYDTNHAMPHTPAPRTALRETTTMPVAPPLPAVPGERHLVPAKKQRTAREADPLMVAVLDKFSLMQQQMFDEFQQTVLMLVQMFGNFHREQMAAINEELEHVRRLTSEMNGLRKELTAPVTPSAPMGDETAEMPPLEDSASLTDTSPNLELPPQQVNGDPPDAGCAEVSQPSAKEMSPVGATNDANLHVWLANRLADLNSERQTRWQRILNFIMGKPR